MLEDVWRDGASLGCSTDGRQLNSVRINYTYAPTSYICTEHLHRKTHVYNQEVIKQLLPVQHELRLHIYLYLSRGGGGVSWFILHVQQHVIHLHSQPGQGEI